MSRETELRVIDWVQWFHYNKDRIPQHDLRKQNEFLMKAVDGCLELLTRVCEDLRIAEGRPTSKRLWLPDGMRHISDSGKVSRYG